MSEDRANRVDKAMGLLERAGYKIIEQVEGNYSVFSDPSKRRFYAISLSHDRTNGMVTWSRVNKYENDPEVLIERVLKSLRGRRNLIGNLVSSSIDDARNYIRAWRTKFEMSLTDQIGVSPS